MTSKFKALICLVGLFISSTILHAQGSGWEVNPHDYQYDMTLYAQLSADESIVTDYANYEIAAFVGDECRGIAEVKSQGGYTWLYLRVRSNVASGESISFKIFDAEAGKAFNAIESVSFASSGQEGMPSSPITLTLKRYTLGDVNDDGEIDVSDVQDLIDLVLSSDDLNFNPACDFNEDGEIDVSDIQALIDYILNQ